MSATPSPRSRRLALGIVLAGFLAFCASLRAPITVLPPIIPLVRSATGLSAAQAGLLTSIPVLAFGVLTLLAARLLARTGVTRGASIALAAMAAGALLRSAGSPTALFAGTAILGAGITIGNLVAPMVIGRDFKSRTALVTSLYATALDILIAISTATAAPLAAALGWTGAAALWGVLPPLLALVAWMLLYSGRRDGLRAGIAARAGRAAPAPARRTASRSTGATRWPMAWLMAAAFGAHNFCYYSLAAWLPSILADELHLDATNAGLAGSVFHLLGMVGPLLLPLAFGPLHWSTRRILLAIAGMWIVMPLGMLLAPAGWLAWSIAGGLAQGAFFGALFTLVIRRTTTVEQNRDVSSLVQTVGYCLAAIGPTAIGAVHDAAGSWRPVFEVLAIVTALLGLLCARIASDSRPMPAIGSEGGRR